MPWRIYGITGNLEALSRGAEQCTFVDSERASIQTIRENLKSLELEGGSVVQADAISFSSNTRYDIVFADPPYWKKAGDRDIVAELLNGKLHTYCSDSAFFIAEAPAGRVAMAPQPWELAIERTYGSCGISIYNKC